MHTAIYLLCKNENYDRYFVHKNESYPLIILCFYGKTLSNVEKIRDSVMIVCEFYFLPDTIFSKKFYWRK